MITLITAPATEPIVAADVKAYLNISTAADDTLLGLLITAVRQYGELYTRRAFISQTQELTLDAFPGQTIQIPNPPLISITSITYTDTDGTSTVLGAANYTVDIINEPGRVVPVYGTTWPATEGSINALKVRYVCGWANAAAVPEGIKTWMKARIGAIYEQRESYLIGGVHAQIQVVPHKFLDGLIDPWRLYLV